MFTDHCCPHRTIELTPVFLLSLTMPVLAGECDLLYALENVQQINVLFNDVHQGMAWGAGHFHSTAGDCNLYDPVYHRYDLSWGSLVRERVEYPDRVSCTVLSTHAHVGDPGVGPDGYVYLPISDFSTPPGYVGSDVWQIARYDPSVPAAKARSVCLATSNDRVHSDARGRAVVTSGSRGMVSESSSGGLIVTATSLGIPPQFGVWSPWTPEASCSVDSCTSPYNPGR